MLLGLQMIAASPASAQFWGNNQQMMFEEGNFEHFAAANPQIANELMRNPNLVNDPRYLASHPQLMAFMKQYPHAAASMHENPAGFIHQYGRSTGAGAAAYGEHHHHHHDDWHY